MIKKKKKKLVAMQGRFVWWIEFIYARGNQCHRERQSITTFVSPPRRMCAAEITKVSLRTFVLKRTRRYFFMAAVEERSRENREGRSANVVDLFLKFRVHA